MTNYMPRDAVPCAQTVISMRRGRSSGSAGLVGQWSPDGPWVAPEVATAVLTLAAGVVMPPVAAAATGLAVGIAAAAASTSQPGSSAEHAAGGGGGDEGGEFDDGEMRMATHTSLNWLFTGCERLEDKLRQKKPNSNKWRYQHTKVLNQECTVGNPRGILGRTLIMPNGFKKNNGVMRAVIKGVKYGDVGKFNHYTTMHATPSSLNEVSLELEIISAWWDFHDFDKDGEPVSMSGKPGVADTYIWAADVMMEKGTRPPALLETGAVRAHNDQIQNAIAIDNVPIEISDSDSD